jgi:hypothetical protein
VRSRWRAGGTKSIAVQYVPSPRGVPPAGDGAHPPPDRLRLAPDRRRHRRRACRRAPASPPPVDYPVAVGPRPPTSRPLSCGWRGAERPATPTHRGWRTTLHRSRPRLSDDAGIPRGSAFRWLRGTDCRAMRPCTKGKHGCDSSSVANPTGRNDRYGCHRVDYRSHQRERRHTTSDVAAGLPACATMTSTRGPPAADPRANTWLVDDVGRPQCRDAQGQAAGAGLAPDFRGWSGQEHRGTPGDARGLM